MKKYIIIALTAAVIVSCNRQMDNAMKSADKDLILKLANEKFANKKWTDALALYERLGNLVAGTDDAPNVVFNSAFANYYDNNYRLAASQFKGFALSFPQDERKEEAAYMSALCYYEGSLDYNLDQTSTDSAINELQDFINNYPDSERSKNISQLIDELTYKLEFKAYENAKQYFKMAEYKAADVALENVLEDFPSTKLRPQILDFILKSRYELAMNSIYDLKMERLDRALAYTRTIEKVLPDTETAKTAVNFRSNLEAEKVKFSKVVADVEKRKAELEAKQKAEDEKQLLENKPAETSPTEEPSVVVKKDSTVVSPADPNSTFRIRR